MEGLKFFEGIIRGQDVVVHKDHLNLLYQAMPAQQMVRWRLLLEEFYPIVKQWLEYVSMELRYNRKFVLDAVQQGGCALQYASDKLRGDKELVMRAVEESGLALRYASAKLKNNRYVVLDAVKKMLMHYKQLLNN